METVDVYILLVTWFVSGQPPMSYEKDFGSFRESCEAARNAILADAERLKAQYGGAGSPFSMAAPQASAVCVVRQEMGPPDIRMRPE